MYKGVRLVEHSGSTAGYRAHLARFPDQRVSVAVLCNVTTGDATAAAHAVADLYLEGSLKAFALRAAAPAELAALAGTFESDEAETILTAAVEGGGLVLKRRPDSTIKLTPTYADAFDAGTFGTVIFRREGNGRVIGLSVSQDRVWDMRFTRRAK